MAVTGTWTWRRQNLKKQNQLKTKIWQVLQIQKRTANVRIGSGDQNKPMMKAFLQC